MSVRTKQQLLMGGGSIGGGAKVDSVNKSFFSLSLLFISGAPTIAYLLCSLP